MSLESEMERLSRLALEPATGWMDRAHSRDYAQKARLDELRSAVEGFLKESTRAIGWESLLADLCVELQKQSDRIVRRWD